MQFGTICHHSAQICKKLWCRAIAYAPKVRDCTKQEITQFHGTFTLKNIQASVIFVIAFLWLVEAAQLLYILYHCVLAIFLILKNCQVSVIFCHYFSLNSGSRSMAVYFVSLCPGNFPNSEKLPCRSVLFFCHCFSLNSGGCSIAAYFVMRWCPGHPCFLHQVFFHWHSPAWFCTRFLHQVFFLSFFGTVRHGFAPDLSCGSETVGQFDTICHHSTQICTKLWCRAIAQ